MKKIKKVFMILAAVSASVVGNQAAVFVLGQVIPLQLLTTLRGERNGVIIHNAAVAQ